MRSVAFSIHSLFAGLGKCHGMVYDGGDHLLFEFQIKDSISGFFKTSVKQVKVPVTRIDTVELCKMRFGKKFGGRLVMQATSLDAFREIPGMAGGTIELNISRTNLGKAEAFVEGLYNNGSSPAQQ